jgi:hypothetical protein
VFQSWIKQWNNCLAFQDEKEHADVGNRICNNTLLTLFLLFGKASNFNDSFRLKHFSHLTLYKDKKGISYPKYSSNSDKFNYKNTLILKGHVTKCNESSSQMKPFCLKFPCKSDHCSLKFIGMGIMNIISQEKSDAVNWKMSTMSQVFWSLRTTRKIPE